MSHARLVALLDDARMHADGFERALPGALGVVCIGAGGLQDASQADSAARMLADTAPDLPVAPVQMALLGADTAPADAVYEIWQCNARDLRSERRGALHYRYSEAAGLVFGSIVLHEHETSGAPRDGGTPLERATHDAYRALFDVLDTLGMPHPLRIWNTVPAINAAQFGIERYRQFNIGRQHAFDACRRALTGGVPAACAQPWEADAALVDVIRARLTGFGPLALDAIAQPLGLPPASIATALAALEREGYVMRGRFTPGATTDEWCERHLLARIHRYTVKRLRREIEPVERADFMRFLFHWQHLTPDTRGSGRDALAAVVEQLEGYEAAASAWEDALLPARLTDYMAGGLDELCRSGKLVWTRIGAPARAAGTPVKTTPIVLLPRRHLAAWQALRDPDAQPALSARATQVRDALAAHGAMFFDALLDDLHMLPVELEQALGELVSAGLVNADSYAGLRALLKPAVKRSATYAPRTRRGGALIGGMDDAGRWALVQRQPPSDDAPTPKRGPAATDPDAVEHIAWTLLRRYGVVFWRLLEREADWLPSWRELVRVLQRLEARGEIRGGRFVAGLAGEQFALPEAIPILRELRRQPGDGQYVCVTGADPLNLAGTLLPGDKVPALAGNRVLFRDGVPVASLVSGTFHYAPELSPAAREDARLRLARYC
ncbi:Lhr family helicase [Burkholderia stabilis]|uniref:Lhr family helicase n=1 Tax=Burkholderia stabilis TaxID=95485 RepID=UPI0030C6EF02